MKIGAIITGDIVDSTKMTAEERATMLRMLQSLPVLLSPLGKTDIEIFRGDSYRLYLEAYNNQNQSEISNHKPLIVSTF